MRRDSPLLAVVMFAVALSSWTYGAYGDELCPNDATYKDDGHVAGCVRIDVNNRPVRIGLWAMRDGEHHVLQEVNYNEAGEQDGVAHTFYPNGSLREESFFTRNRPTGTWTVWYESNLKKEERNYVNGELHGLRQMWDERGQPNGMKCFVRGKPKPISACAAIEVVND